MNNAVQGTFWAQLPFNDPGGGIDIIIVQSGELDSGMIDAVPGGVEGGTWIGWVTWGM